jgi:quinol monooxygenase YgiN
MGKVAVLAKLVAHEGRGDELVAAFEELFEQVEQEAGTEVYALNRSTKEPDVFWFYELYGDRDAFQAHGSSDAMQRAFAVLGPLMASSELVIGEPVRAKGVSL